MCYTEYMPPHKSVRELDPDLWRRLRAAALFEGITVGQLLNRIIREWLEAR